MDMDMHSWTVGNLHHTLAKMRGTREPSLAKEPGHLNESLVTSQVSILQTMIHCFPQLGPLKAGKTGLDLQLLVRLLLSTVTVDSGLKF